MRMTMGRQQRYRKNCHYRRQVIALSGPIRIHVASRVRQSAAPSCADADRSALV